MQTEPVAGHRHRRAAAGTQQQEDSTDLARLGHQLDYGDYLVAPLRFRRFSDGSISFDLGQRLLYVDRGMAAVLQCMGYVLGTFFSAAAHTGYFHQFLLYAFLVYFVFALQFAPTVGPNGLWCASWQGPMHRSPPGRGGDSAAWEGPGELGYTARVPLGYSWALGDALRQYGGGVKPSVGMSPARH